MAGYSGKSLIEKLGLKPGFKVYFDNPPKSFEKEIKDFQVESKLSGQLDFILTFVTDQNELADNLDRLKPFLSKAGAIWVSWPKGSSQIPKNINENNVRQLGLDKGLVDVKVVAIDRDWSGLKFVYRLKDR